MHPTAQNNILKDNVTGLIGQAVLIKTHTLHDKDSNFVALNVLPQK